MPRVVIGLGSNIGERHHNLQQAVLALGEELTDLVISQPIETNALLPKDAPPEWDKPFLNMAVAASTSLAPLACLDYLQTLEQRLGRVKEGVWSPRVIDLDLLAYGQEVVDHPRLAVPHLALLQREFALWPLAEVWPQWSYPRPGEYFGLTANELAQQCQPNPTFTRSEFPQLP